MAYKFVDRYASASLNGILTVGDNKTFEVTAGPPSFPAGHTVIATIEDNRSTPTTYEDILITAVSGTTFAIPTGGRGFNGTEQEWPDGSHISFYVQDKVLNDKVDNTGSLFSAKGISAEVFNNGASGAFDYNNGEQQKCTLTSAGTVISFSNIPEGGMCTAVITDADSFGPDTTGLTWDENGAPTFAKITVIHAINANGTVRYSAGKRWSA